MRASTAYFVGAGTIVAAIAIGLGGGLVAGNIMNPISPKKGNDVAKTERRAEPVAAANAASAPVQYLTGSQAFGGALAASTQPEARSTASSERPAPQPAQATAANEPKQADVQPAPQAKPAEQKASSEPASSPENAYAKARESDVRQAASERRRSERRQRWAERRRYYDPREPRESRGHPDWDDVARNVREDSDSRDYSSGPRSGFPQIRLFGPDDD